MADVIQFTSKEDKIAQNLGKTLISAYMDGKKSGIAETLAVVLNAYVTWEEDLEGNCSFENILEDMITDMLTSDLFEDDEEENEDE